MANASGYYKHILSIAISCFTLAACGTSGLKQTSSESSVYDRVIKQGSIRCGYVIYNPGCLKDPNTGKLSGIGVETLELAAKNLGLKVEWSEEVGWGSMIEGLQTNRYDMVVTPVWTNANRARQIDFSKPLFFSPIFAYAKIGNKQVSGKDIKAFDSPASTIATVDGETAEIIVREDFPNAKVVSLPQLSDISQMLLTVSSGKADITFVEPAVAAAFLKTNPGAIEPLKSNTPVRVFPNSWMFRRGQLEFKDMIDTALEQLINSGAVDKIISKYEPAPNTLYRVALPYQKPHD